MCVCELRGAANESECQLPSSRQGDAERSQAVGQQTPLCSHAPRQLRPGLVCPGHTPAGYRFAPREGKPAHRAFLQGLHGLIKRHCVGNGQSKNKLRHCCSYGTLLFVKRLGKWGVVVGSPLMTDRYWGAPRHHLYHSRKIHPEVNTLHYEEPG